MSTNIILKVSIENKTYYFRECERHLPIRAYVNNFIDLYFDVLLKDDEYSLEDKKSVLESLKNKTNFKKFVSIDGSCADFWTNGRIAKADPIIYGLNGCGDIDFIHRLKGFLHFSMCKLQDYRANQPFVKVNDYQTLNSQKELAYNELSKLFDLGEYVPETFYGCLCINSQTTLFGTFAEEAKGVYANDYQRSERKQKVTPSLQMHLSNLRVLDYLSLMHDHNESNYKVILDEDGFFTKICVFDNNESCAFLYERVLYFSGTHSESCLIDKSKQITTPNISDKVEKSLDILAKKDFILSLHKYLSKKQILNTFERFLLLKKVVCEAKESNEHFVLKENEWNQHTIEEELSGKYGITYLVRLVGR